MSYRIRLIISKHDNNISCVESGGYFTSDLLKRDSNNIFLNKFSSSDNYICSDCRNNHVFLSNFINHFEG